MCFFPRDRRPVPPTLLSKKCNQIHRWRRNSWNNSKPSLTAKNPPTHNTTLNPVRSINTDSLSNSELIILGHRQQSSCCQDEEKRRNLLETRRNGKKTLDSSITKKNWRSQERNKRWMIPETKSKDSSRQIFALPSMHKTGHSNTLAEAKEIAIWATSSDWCSAEDVRTREGASKCEGTTPPSPALMTALISPFFNLLVVYSQKAN